jgi:GTP-binding protein
MPRPEVLPLEFIGGAATAEQALALGHPDSPRIVFAGRSNVGKSSLLNKLVGSRVARVSATPGKTREMNFFRWRPGWIANVSDARARREGMLLVDLPGYGYAKVARELRADWGREITQWLANEDHIASVVCLVDGRHGFLENDVELVGFLKGHEVPFVVAFTKMDKHKSRNARAVAERALADRARALNVPRHVFASAEDAGGTKELENVLKELFGLR